MSKEVKKTKIETIEELGKLFAGGILRAEDGDVVIFDKGEAELWTSKPYLFSMSTQYIVWSHLNSLGINAEFA